MTSKSRFIKSIAAKILLVVGLVSTGVSATEAGKKAIEQNFKRFNIVISNIEKSPVNGLYEVMTDRGLFYFSEDGKFLLNGSIIDMETRQDIKEVALSKVRKAGLVKYADSMISYPAENEKYQVTVFTDITCGYCRKLHSQIEEYNKLGITVNYLAFPRGGPNRQSFNDMERIWCADNKTSALTDAKTGGDINGKNCQTASVADHYKLGMQFGVTGTPAIVMPDGTMIPGYQPPEQLLNALKTL